MPTFLQFDLNVKSRDKTFGQLAAAIEKFTMKYQQNTKNNGIVAVLLTDEKPLKRTRRAVEEVNIAFFRFFLLRFFFSNVSNLINLKLSP